MSAAQSDLFAGPHLDGLMQADGIVTRNEEQALIASIDAAQLSPFRFHGWLGKRLTASFGWNYDFETARFAPTEPIPDWLFPLREWAARFARLKSDDLVQALLIRYDPGAGIGWHRDRPVFEHVVGISLGAPATMRFRQRRSGGFDRASAELTPRSIYHLSGEARHKWEHSIAEMAVTRWSVTFRSLAQRSRWPQSNERIRNRHIAPNPSAEPQALQYVRHHRSPASQSKSSNADTRGCTQNTQMAT